MSDVVATKSALTICSRTNFAYLVCPHSKLFHVFFLITKRSKRETSRRTRTKSFSRAMSRHRVSAPLLFAVSVSVFSLIPSLVPALFVNAIDVVLYGLVKQKNSDKKRRSRHARFETSLLLCLVLPWAWSFGHAAALISSVCGVAVCLYSENYTTASLFVALVLSSVEWTQHWESSFARWGLVFGFVGRVVFHAVSDKMRGKRGFQSDSTAQFLSRRSKMRKRRRTESAAAAATTSKTTRTAPTTPSDDEEDDVFSDGTPSPNKALSFGTRHSQSLAIMSDLSQALFSSTANAYYVEELDSEDDVAVGKNAIPRSSSVLTF
jgi:hypothetical protein